MTMSVYEPHHRTWVADTDNDIPTNRDLQLQTMFDGLMQDEMLKKRDKFLKKTGLEDDERLFTRAMYLVKDGLGAFEPDGNATMANIHLHEEELLDLELDETVPKGFRRQHGNRLPDGSCPVRTTHAHSRWNAIFGKWRLRSHMWKLVITCSLGAVVQGWDEAAINGAQRHYLAAFNLKIVDRPGIVGLVNSAPYLCCFFSCWLTPFMNRKLGRRGTVFWTATFSAVFAFLQGLSQSWQQLFAFRLLLGLGIGPKSATSPIYLSEAAPSSVRGGLVMLWQLFTACGIMLGCIFGVAFQGLGSSGDANCMDAQKQNDLQKLLSFQCSMTWRFILASPMVAPAILATIIWTQPESPRWKISRGHKLRRKRMVNRAKKQYREAFETFCLLRNHRIQAARDMFAVYHLLKEEQEINYTRRDDPATSWTHRGFAELLSVARNRRAVCASLVCMAAQQFCGVNAIIYYSNLFFSDSNPTSGDTHGSEKSYERALLFTMGFGIINAVFGLPAFFTIDSIGRRTLLLLTFPCLALCQFLISVAVAKQNETFLWVSVYLFGVFYSPGEGPIPFVYAAESLPLYIRDMGMGFATSINWLFNWVIAMTFPVLYKIGNPDRRDPNQGHGYAAFIVYGAFCIIFWFMIFFFVPETRQLSLEQLNEVFEKPTREFASHALDKAKFNVCRIFRKDQERPKALYELDVTNRYHRPRHDTSRTSSVAHEENITEQTSQHISNEETEVGSD